MWFGSWFGTEYTGLWWGDGTIVPPIPTPSDGFPIGLKNVAWRPLKHAPVEVHAKVEREPQPVLRIVAEPQGVINPLFQPVIDPVFEPIDVGGIERQVEAALRGELSRAKAGARATPAPDAPAPDPVEDDAEDLEAIIVLMHVI